MKISQASKKVLASALSAAMVVAFAPTVALGAQADGKSTIKVTYDFDGGTDYGVNGTQYLLSEQDAVITGTTMNNHIVTAVIEYTQTANKDTAPAAGADWKNETVLALTAAGDCGIWARVSATTTAGDTIYGEPSLVYHGPIAAVAAGEAVGNIVSSVEYAIGTGVKATGTASDSAGIFTNPATDVDDANEYEWATAKVTSFWTNPSTAVSGAKLDARDTNTTTIAIQQPQNTTVNGVTGKQLRKGQYLFQGWEYYYDANQDGDYEDADDVNGEAVVGGSINVSAAKFGAGREILVKAVYAAPSITANTKFGFAQKSETPALIGQATIKPVATFNNANAKEGVEYTVTLAKDGAEIATKSVGSTATVTFDEMAVEAGASTMTLKDATNGYELGTEELLIGAVEITGGYFESRAASQVLTDSQTVFYVADADNGTAYSEILSASGNAMGVDIRAVDDEGTNAMRIYDGTGTQIVGFVGGTHFFGEKTKKGAVTTKLYSFFGEDGIIAASMDANNVFNITTFSDPGNNYYLTVADPEGNIVAENACKLGTIGTWKGIDNDTANDIVDGNFSTLKSLSDFTVTLGKDLVAGDYTVTLCQVVPGTATTDATVKTVDSKVISASIVAAPTWAYTADEDATKGGTLVLTNNAGGKYDVVYKIGDGGYTKYAAGSTGIKITNAGFASSITIQAKKNSTAKATDLAGSVEVKIFGYNQTNAWTTAEAFINGVSYQTVNGSKTVTYGADEGVKTAMAAAKKAFTDAGFAEGNSAAQAWAKTVSATERSVLAAAADVAKAQVEALYAGVAATDGTLTKVSTDNYEKAIAAIDSVLDAFDKNWDKDITNNVAKVNGVTLNNTGAKYAEAIDAAVKAAQAAAVKYAAADVAAAQAVTDALKAATTGEAAEAAIKAYAALTDAQKELVNVADVAAAEAVKDAADKAAAEEEAKKAEEAAAAALAAQQDEAAVKYCNSTKSKTVKIAKGAKKTKKAATITWKSKVSASGNVVTYAWKSGSKSIKIDAAGTATLKKGVKAGTYKAKVSVVCGAATRTVNVKFVVK